MLFSIRTHTVKCKLKWKDRTYIISAHSSLLFAGKLERNLKTKKNKVWLVRGLRMEPSGQSLYKTNWASWRGCKWYTSVYCLAFICKSEGSNKNFPFTLKVEAVFSSSTVVPTYHTTQCHNLQDYATLHHSNKLKSHTTHNVENSNATNSWVFSEQLCVLVVF